MKTIITIILFLSGISLLGQVPLNSPSVISVSNVSSGFDNNGYYEISWMDNNSPSSLVDSFIIYKYVRWNSIENIPQYEPIAKIKNTYVNYYRYTPTDELTKVVFFAVEAIPVNKSMYKNSSSNLTRVPWQNAPSNIYLNFSIDNCNNQIILSWNKFYGWENITRYNFRIEYQEGNQPVKTLNVLGSEYLINDTSIRIPSSKTQNFSFQNLNYKFRVTAVNFLTGYSCISNIIEFSPSFPNVSKYINTDGTKVISNNHIEITFSLDPNNQLNKLVIYRSLSESHSFEPIDTVTLEGNIFAYNDNTVENLDKTRYYYKASLLNDCHEPVIGLESNLGSNILLKLTAAQPPQNTNLLSWDFYKYFRGNVKEYIVYRIRQSGAIPIGTTTDNKLLDDLTLLEDKQVFEDVCYQVEAVEQNNPYGVNGHVWSNTVCMTIQAYIQMPKYLVLGNDCKSKAIEPYRFPAHAFTPSKFHMIIFDRWGTKVFETTDVSEGWYGTYKNGKVATQGAYMYYIKYSGTDNKAKEQKGSFVVICPEKK